MEIVITCSPTFQLLEYLVLIVMCHKTYFWSHPRSALHNMVENVKTDPNTVVILNPELCVFLTRAKK